MDIMNIIAMIPLITSSIAILAIGCFIVAASCDKIADAHTNQSKPHKPTSQQTQKHRYEPQTNFTEDVMRFIDDNEQLSSVDIEALLKLIKTFDTCANEDYLANVKNDFGLQFNDHREELRYLFDCFKEAQRHRKLEELHNRTDQALDPIWTRKG